jgi:arylsulfatase A-like enzyme
VTLDTLRADRIGAYGHAAAATPTLDRLAREGILFEQALATAPITLPSHASILTGVDPPVHGLRDNGIFVLAPEALLVSEVLRRHGWRTGAFVGSYMLDPRFGLDQGFEVYSAPPLSASGVNLLVERRADAVIGDAVAWLEGVAPGERFFAWVHLYDPHAPYDPPEPWSRRFEDAYDGEIAFCDAQLARLLEQIGRLGLDENLLVVVTADHGESLGEHGEATHGIFLYQSTLRVPLLVSGASAARGVRVSWPVSNAALPATLLALAGLDPAELSAQARAPLLAPDGTPERPPEDAALYVESELPYYSYRWRALRGLLHGSLKLVEGRDPELYDIASDPHERTDLAATRPEALASMRRRLSALLEGHGAVAGAGHRLLDPGDRERLAALGYVPGAVGGDPYGAELPDPRRRVGDVALYDEAAALYAEGVRLGSLPAQSVWQREQNESAARAALGSARELALRVVAASPDAMAPLTLLGLAETLLGNAGAAVEVLEKLVRLYPEDAVAQHNLALAYFAAGRDADGVRALERAIALQPGQPAYPLRLATHYADAGDAERAAHWLERTRALGGAALLQAQLEALQARLASPDGS